MELIVRGAIWFGFYIFLVLFPLDRRSISSGGRTIILVNSVVKGEVAPVGASADQEIHQRRWTTDEIWGCHGENIAGDWRLRLSYTRNVSTWPRRRI